MTETKTFPPRIAAAIFDFDETMVDLEAQHTEASSALCRAMGSDYGQMPEAWRKGSGRRVIDDVRDLRKFFGWTENLEDLFALRQRFFDEACRNSAVTLLPGVDATIHAIHRFGIRLAITSSSVRRSIEILLERLDLANVFELIVDGAEVSRGKPDPEAYLVTAKRLGLAPSECIVFEDSGIGVAAAKAAGMFCVAVRNPRAKTFQDLSAADILLSEFEEFDEAWLKHQAAQKA